MPGRGRTGTTSLASISTATSTSWLKPEVTNSTPEALPRTSSGMESLVSYAARAAAASGDSEQPPCSASAASTAPAPSRSSSAGRSDPSGHRSPAAMTAKGPSCRCVIHAATARALRREAATTTRPPAAAAIAEPLGDGRTRRAGARADRSAAGDNDHGCAVVTSRRSTARTAPSVSASALSRKRLYCGRPFRALLLLPWVR